jgi:predicted alpha/beta hydrolase family esterase
LPWLQKQLIIRDIPAATPEVPNSWIPDYPTWERELMRYDLTEKTLLVGHSLGAGFLLRWLSEHPELHPAKLVCVAPWLNLLESADTGTFLDFHLDPGVSHRTSLVVISSKDDSSGVLATVELLHMAFPTATYREFTNRGHFCAPDCTEFPELLAELLADH